MFLITLDSPNNYFIVYYIDNEKFVSIICNVDKFVKQGKEHVLGKLLL